VLQTATGAGLNLNGNYIKPGRAVNPMKLVFTKNIPLSGTIRIEKADSVWSGDYTHPDPVGNYVYGQAYISKLNELL